MSSIDFTREVIRAVWRDRHCSEQGLLKVTRSRFEKILRYARSHVPFQRERLYGVANDLECLTEIPPTDKPSMMAAFSDTVTDRAVTLDDVQRAVESAGKKGAWVHGRFLALATSGTTGKPAWLLNDSRSWHSQRGAVFARTLRERLVPSRMLRFAFGRRLRVAMMVTDMGPSISRLTGTESGSLSRLFGNIRTLAIEDPAQRNLEALRRFQPHYLHAYPSTLELVLRLGMAESKGVGFCPEVVSFGSERASASAWRLATAAFPNSRITEQYGTTECSTLANCCLHNRLHLNVDYSIVEPVDEHDQPVPKGSFSHHVLITNLLNRVHPIIRYRLTDSIRVHETPCPCGRLTPTIEVQGRTEDAFMLRDNRGAWQRVSPMGFEATVLVVPGVTQFEVIHLEQNLISINIVPAADADADTVCRQVSMAMLRHLLRQNADRSVRIQVQYVRELTPLAPGKKRRQVYSLVAPPVLPNDGNLAA